VNGDSAALGRTYSNPHLKDARGPTAGFAKHAIDRWNGDFLNAYRPSDPPE